MSASRILKVFEVSGAIYFKGNLALFDRVDGVCL